MHPLTTPPQLINRDEDKVGKARTTPLKSHVMQPTTPRQLTKGENAESFIKPCKSFSLPNPIEGTSSKEPRKSTSKTPNQMQSATHMIQVREAEPVIKGEE
jgi:hypothetical protein